MYVAQIQNISFFAKKDIEKIIIYGIIDIVKICE